MTEPPTKRVRRGESPMGQKNRPDHKSGSARARDKPRAERPRSRSHSRGRAEREGRRRGHRRGQSHSASRSRSHSRHRNRDRHRDHRDRDRDRDNMYRDRRARSPRSYKHSGGGGGGGRSRSPPSNDHPTDRYESHRRSSRSPLGRSNARRHDHDQPPSSTRVNGTSNPQRHGVSNPSAMDIDAPVNGDADMDPEAVEMQRLMGFSGFKSTKNTKVKGNNVYGVRKEKKTEYRQYMNRLGGFNRPLSPGR